jgi:hypothetical protein
MTNWNDQTKKKYASLAYHHKHMVAICLTWKNWGKNPHFGVHGVIMGQQFFLRETFTN